MQQGEPSGPPPPTVAAAAVRLPPYWVRNQRVWFLQAESQFHLAGVTTQGRKYHHVVSAPSPAAADEVYDVLANPCPATPYDQLKNALLQGTEVSERSRVQQLLWAEELGDRRPSQLLRRMTQLLGERANNMDDVFLRELFLQRLPSNVQMVLATATTLDLTGLAAPADAVMEVTTPSVANVTVAPQQPTALYSASAANSQPPQANIEKLCRRLEEIVVAATQGRLASVNQKLDVLLSLKESVDTLLTLPAKVDAVLALKPTVEWLQTTVKEVEESVTFINAQYDSMVVEAAAQKQLTQDLRAEVGAL
ncbi:uncharacterized protein LOC121046801 [Ixodes scapularis]|uniref:uncharacterized protein LOC121046801 n=1 Tax=Ixodes scapularis TaxID=6945 RepID=UPI001AD7ABB2|nr:uncharacterized protein LOC121046801 [Ixodes scapularis]